MSVAYALRTLQVLYSIPRLVFAFTVCVMDLILLARFRKPCFLLRITLFGKKKREAKKLLPWVWFCWLQSYRLLDGDDQATVRRLSANQSDKLIISVAEGQAVYSFLFVHIDQDFISDLRSERALDV